MSNSLFFPLALRPAPLSAFFWLFPALAALGRIATYGQEGRGRANMAAIGRWQRSSASGILPVLALVALWLAPLAGTVLSFFELWPLGLFAVVAVGARGGPVRGAAIPLVLLCLGGVLPAIALLLLGGSCHTAELQALGGCASSRSGLSASLAFLLALGGAVGTWLGVASAIWQGRRGDTAVPGGASGGTGAWIGDAWSCLAFYPILVIVLHPPEPNPLWWGATVILLGAALTLTGAIRGLGEESLSGLLAGTGLAHQGMALLPLGAALVLRSEGEIAAASQAEGAALLLLLCCALARCGLGIAVEAAGRAGSRRISDRGGLWRRMPRTGTTMLIGALGAGLAPPLGGFAAGWLALHALLAAGGRSLPAGYGGLALLGAGVLLLGGSLLLIAWLRAFGATFLGPQALGPPSSDNPNPEGSVARRAWKLTGASEALLGGGVLLAGVAPGLPLALVRRAVQDNGPAAWGPSAGDWLRLRPQPIPSHAIPVADGGAALIPLSLLIAVCCLLLVTAALGGLAGTKRTAPAGTWAMAERPHPAPATPGRGIALLAALLGWRGAELDAAGVGTLARGATAWAARGGTAVARIGIAVRQAARAGSGSRLPAAAWLLTIVVLLALAR